MSVMMTKMSSMSKSEFSTPVACAYTGCFTIALVVYHAVAGGAYSSILTMSVLVQCLATCFLVLQVLTTGSAAGVSARALMLDGLAIAFRLSCTVWLDGYLPVDASGDYLFQMIDGVSLMMIIWLLHHVLVVNRLTYQADSDNWNIGPMVLVSLLLAALFHADMNGRPLFDTFWMTGLNLSVVAVLPQLWLVMQTGGKSEALVSHYIAAMAVSRILSGLFMWEARSHITCNEWIYTGFSHGIVAILTAHLLQMCVLGDFAYYYCRSIMQKGLGGSVDMTSSSDFV